MSTHNVPFSIEKENHPKLSQICSYGIFKETQERVLIGRGKRAISLLYFYFCYYYYCGCCYLFFFIVPNLYSDLDYILSSSMEIA